MGVVNVFERLFQPLSDGGLFSNQRKSISRCPKSPFVKNSKSANSPNSFASCQQTRLVPTAAPLTPWMWPGTPWHRVHADFAKKEGQHFFVMVAAHSKWPEILPMSSTTAAATIAAFRDVFARFGFPVYVVTKNGPQFINAKFDEFLRWKLEWSQTYSSRPVPPREQWCCRANGAVIEGERKGVGQHWSIHEAPSG